MNYITLILTVLTLIYTCFIIHIITIQCIAIMFTSNNDDNFLFHDQNQILQLRKLTFANIQTANLIWMETELYF